MFKKQCDIYGNRGMEIHGLDCVIQDYIND